MSKAQFLKTSGMQFDNWLFRPKQFSELQETGPSALLTAWQYNEECTTKLPTEVVHFCSHQEHNLIDFLKTQNDL